MATDLTVLSTSGQVTVTKGNNLINLDFTISDASGEIVNLTGCSIKFKMALPEATVLKVDGTCSIIDASKGVCRYTFTSANLDTVGTYLAELEITFTSGRIITVPDLVVEVESNLPRGASG